MLTVARLACGLSGMRIMNSAPAATLIGGVTLVPLWLKSFNSRMTTLESDVSRLAQTDQLSGPVTTPASVATPSGFLLVAAALAASLILLFTRYDGTYSSIESERSNATLLMFLTFIDSCSGENDSMVSSSGFGSAIWVLFIRRLVAAIFPQSRQLVDR